MYRVYMFAHSADYEIDAAMELDVAQIINTALINTDYSDQHYTDSVVSLTPYPAIFTCNLNMDVKHTNLIQFQPVLLNAWQQDYPGKIGVKTLSSSTRSKNSKIKLIFKLIYF